MVSLIDIAGGIIVKVRFTIESHPVIAINVS